MLSNQINTKQWQKQILKDSPKFHFLVAVLPMMQNILNHISIQSKNIIHRKALQEFILRSFKNDVLLMIIQVFVLELHLFKKQKKLKGKTASLRFQDFINQIENQSIADKIINKYPVLKSQLKHYVKQKIRFINELSNRLEKDSRQIQKTFFNDEKSIVNKIESVGDRHCGGQQVLILTFCNHKKIVYKPHAIKVDFGFQQIFAWSNLFLDAQLKIIKMISKSNYGWCEYIDYQSCQTKKEIESFYYQSGILLMFCYIFYGFDIHMENLIAHGCHPVMIDYECFLIPCLDHKIISRNFVNSILFLPKKELLGDKYIDISAMGGYEKITSAEKNIHWLNIGKDNMMAVRQSFAIKSICKHKPKLKNHQIDYLEYEKIFLEGFKDCYSLILKHKNTFLAMIEKLFYNAKVRLVLRNTDTYAILLYEKWHSDLLKSQGKTDRYFSWLREESNVPKKIISSEMYDLNHNDIPYFYGHANQKKLFNSRGKILKIPINYSGLDLAKWTIKEILSKKDIFIQTQIIKNAFEAARLNEIKRSSVLKRKKIQVKVLSEKTMKLKACQLAKKELQKLIELSISNHRRLFWPLVEYENDHWNADFTPAYLYNGISGIGLTFAYASKIFNNKVYKSIAKKIFNSIDKIIVANAHKLGSNLGAFEGLAGILYFYYHLKSLKVVNIPQRKFLQIIDVINNHLDLLEDTDIISGYAGILLIMLSLQTIVNKTNLQKICDHLVDKILQYYPNPKACPLLGFSHGLTGIIFALFKYQQIFPNKKITRWIHRAMRIEQEMYSTKHQNWPDLRETKPNYTVAYWCNGAAGMGLARLKMFQEGFNEKNLLTDIQRSLIITKKLGFKKYDCLCHGAFGNLNLFLNASNVLYDPLINRTYTKLCSKHLNALEANQSYFDMVSNDASPGFMTGRAGIIYQLLRIAYPKVVPDILLLE